MARLVRACGLVGLFFLHPSLGCSSGSDPLLLAGGGQQGVGSNSGLGGGGPIVTITPSDLAGLKASCGNGKADNNNEQCDDGNREGGDGCSKSCQVENAKEWQCPRTGPCVSKVACGDGLLASKEACDDHNQKDGDGCAADCSHFEEGWLCKVPGKDCVPDCGDGKILEGHEQCDDSNKENGDGCSNTCLVEPGFTCANGKCVKSECGNEKVEAGESCDAGKAKNGLFYGNGTGCSKTCTPEPACRDQSGKTIACTTRCGDGNIDKDRGEDCDDANGVSGDGCSADCKVEDGFACANKETADTDTCGTAKCLKLPIILRDFDGQNSASTGHPDFFYMGSTVDGTKTICVPNASGRQPGTSGSCWGNDSTPLCKELVNSKLGSDGKPTLNTSRSGGSTCDCRFTDWDKTGILANATGTQKCQSGDSGEITYAEFKGVKVIKSADSFKEWYTKTSKSDEYIDTLELTQVGTTNQYQFSSSKGRSVYDDIHDIFLKSSGGTVPAGAVTRLESGFFPKVMEDSTRPKVCNLWPYWAGPGASTNCTGKGWDARANDGKGSEVASVTGMKRNFYFTSEVRYLFRYAGGESLEFYGDDDVYVFINGILVLDLGAPHERLKGTVKLTDKNTADAKIQALDVTTAAATEVGTQKATGLGLETGKTYEIAIFHADRHPRESNYQLTLFGFSTTKSECKAECGNGVRTMGEECDEGSNNKPDAYNGCTPDCKYGPFCGDGVVNGDEECDHARDNGDTYGKDGCTGDCRTPHYCGDGITDGANDEECDTKGPTSTCDEKCHLIWENIK